MTPSDRPKYEDIPDYSDFGQAQQEYALRLEAYATALEAERDQLKAQLAEANQQIEWHIEGRASLQKENAKYREALEKIKDQGCPDDCGCSAKIAKLALAQHTEIAKKAEP